MNTKVLFVAPLSPPVTGQSLACDLLYRYLMVNKYDVALVNLVKRSFSAGFNGFHRVIEVVRILWAVFLSRDFKCAYFTISESLAGNLKDLVVLLICFRRIDRLVIHLHGGAGMRLLLSDKHPLLRAVNSFFLRRIGGVIVLGDSLKKIYEGIIPPSRLHVVPNFAMDELFVSATDIEEKFSKIEPLRVLFLSNLLPGKGHKELLAALALLPAELKGRLQVDFAGGFESDDDEFAFKRAVQGTKGVTINVCGVVQGEFKKELLRRAHLFCLPTYYPYEGQPISILEAYASGCAVMTTNHSGIFDTFTPGVNGFEVEPRSPQSIADAILSAVHNAPKLKDYGKNNLEEAQRKYRACTHVAALERVILSVGE